MMRCAKIGLPDETVKPDAAGLCKVMLWLRTTGYTYLWL